MMNLTDSRVPSRSNLSGIFILIFLHFSYLLTLLRFVYNLLETEELVIEYVLNQHRQDLISILEAEDAELHYSVVVQ